MRFSQGEVLSDQLTRWCCIDQLSRQRLPGWVDPTMAFGDAHPARAWRALRALTSRVMVARFLQKFSNDSTPPNNVVNIVESANKMSPARFSSGGIQMNVLNSRFPASVKGCGLDISIGCLART